MKVTVAANKTPLLLVAVSLIAAVGMVITAASVTSGGSIFFTVTRAAFADDLTEEDILSLKDPTQQKVTICHYPPGDPDNAHEITIGASAVAAHVREHGDTSGACPPPPPCPNCG